MANEEAGEWKLLKVWQCGKCKLLIHDGRKIYDHRCNEKDKEEEILRLRKNIEDLQKIIGEHSIIVENKNTIIDSNKNRIQGLENFIEELNNAIADKDKNVKNCEQTINEKRKIIIELESEIAELKKQSSKVVEKVIYVDQNIKNIDTNEESNDEYSNNHIIDNINVDILQRIDRIKDSKDEGYREEIEFEIFAKGKGREKIIVKNGKVVKKPNDIILIGKRSPEGFIIKGIYRN